MNSRQTGKTIGRVLRQVTAAPSPPKKAYRGPPATLGGSAAAGVRFVVWCAVCGHRAELDPAAMAQRYGAETTLPDWQARLVCGACGSHAVEMVVTGTRRD